MGVVFYTAFQKDRPNLKSSCNFFLSGCVIKDRVFVPPVTTNPDGFENRITAAVTSVEEDTLRGVWDVFNKFKYCLDVFRTAGRGNIEHL